MGLVNLGIRNENFILIRVEIKIGNENGNKIIYLPIKKIKYFFFILFKYEIIIILLLLISIFTQ